MNNLPDVHGEKIVSFLETQGCNIRDQIGEHMTMWSVYTGDFFVVPLYEEPLNSLTLKHIIWHLGLTEDAFLDMWGNYNNVRI